LIVYCEFRQIEDRHRYWYNTRPRAIVAEITRVCAGRSGEKALFHRIDDMAGY